MQRGVVFLFSIIYILYAGSFTLMKGQSRDVSLEECINIALQHHPGIKTSAEDENSAVAQYKVARSRKRLQVYLGLNTVEYLKPEASQGKFNVPGQDTTIGLFVGPTATYNLYDPKRSEAVEVARLSIDLSKLKAVKVKSSIINSIKKAYYTYGLARETSLLREELMKKFEAKLKRARVLFRLGQRPILDVSKSEVDLEASKLEYERAKNQENLSKSNLLSSMGIVQEDIAFSPTAFEELPELKYNLKELYNLSENNYPDLKIVRLQKDIGRTSISMEKSAYYPSVDLTASLGFENKQIQGKDNFSDNYNKSNWNPAFHAGITAQVPLYTGGGISGKIDVALADYNKILYQEQEIMINMRSLLKSYYQEMVVLKRQLEIARLSITNAENHLKLAQKSYDNGLGSQLEMQDAELSVLNAQMSFIKAKYEYMIALANLSHVVGLGEDKICLKK